jgi:hypothetical protein
LTFFLRSCIVRSEEQNRGNKKQNGALIMQAKDLVGKRAIRTSETRYGDRSYMENYLTILAVTDNHIIAEERIFCVTLGREVVLGHDFVDDNWADYDEFIKLEKSKKDMPFKPNFQKKCVLKVKFEIKENKLYMQILEQDERFRRRIGETQDEYTAKNGICICSSLEPEIKRSRLFLRGIDKNTDCISCSFAFSSHKEAREKLEEFKEALKDWSENCQELHPENISETLEF